MKKRIAFLFSLLIIISSIFAVSVYADENISVWLNGTELSFDVEPIMVNSRILVPFRGILEALGADVEYEEVYGQGIAKGKTKGREIVIHVEKKFVAINDCIVEIDVPAQITDGRTLVPVRVVSECLGADVSWDNTKNAVIITTKGDAFVDWNDKYYYWGDIADDGYTVTGYGSLYFISNDKCYCSGYFDNNIITEGKLNFSDGSYYIGEFSEKLFSCRNGKGTQYTNDGLVITGTWVNDVLDGKFTQIDVITSEIISGTAINGRWDGEISVYSPSHGTTETYTYKNGVMVSDYLPEPIYGGEYNTSINFGTALYPLYLYSNDGKTYLGKLTTNKYDTESFSNEYGIYGSKYSATSIFNEYGTYGSKYSNDSAFNSYATNPPKVVDSNGNFVAYLTENKYKIDGVTYTELISILKQRSQ